MSDASPELRAFLEGAATYRTTGSDLAARRLFRSPFSGVRNEIAAAILTVGQPGEPLGEAIGHERVALSATDRDAVFTFAERLAVLRDATESRDARRVFELPESAEAARSTTDDVTAGERLHLRPAVAPEIPATIRSNPPHFSASSLNTLVECRRKWFYRYLCCAIEDRGSSASFYGKVFHAALEALHKEFPRPGEVPAQTLRSKLQGYLNSAFDHHRNNFETPVEFELQRRRAQRTASRYVDWLASAAAAAPFTVIGCELQVKLELEGYAFVGYIDRLDRDDRTAGVTVIDYKTGAIAATAEEYREKVRQFKEFQLPFYYWARSAQGDRVTTLALVPLKDALSEVTPIALEVVPLTAKAALSGAERASRSRGTAGTISIEELERARVRMIELCREVTSGDVQRFAETLDASACRYCAYEIACNSRPFPIEERFAR